MNTTRCEFCGRELEPVTVELGGTSYTVGYEPCMCSQAIEARAIEEAEENKRLAEAEKARVEAKIREEGIRPRYRGLTHSKAYEVAIACEVGRNVYICGAVGTGKTTLASAAAKRLIEDNHSVLFKPTAELLGELREFDAEVVNRCKAVDVLILDDLGKENPTGYTLERLFDIIDHRNGYMLPTITTSQLKPGELERQLAKGGNRTGIAIVSRLRQDCDLIETSGKDRRLSC